MDKNYLCIFSLGSNENFQIPSEITMTTTLNLHKFLRKT